MQFEVKQDKSGARWYQPEDSDEWYPSVTTVKSILSNEGLKNWFKHSSAEEIKQKTEHGINVGNIVHDCIEELLTHGSCSIDDIEDNKVKKDASKYLQGFMNFYEEHTITPQELEVSVLNSKYEIAGTIDFVGKLDGELALIDWKTSNSKDEIGWSHQLTSYGTSDPFINKDYRPNLYVCHLKKRTKKGFQLRPFDYDEELVDKITWLWNRVNDSDPSFREEPETNFNLEEDNDDE